MRIYIDAIDKLIIINEDDGTNSDTTIDRWVERSRTGIPCMWESGGSNTNTGDATIIGNKYGCPKKPIYIRTSGVLACEPHALIPIRIGDVIIDASRHHDDIEIKNYIVKEIADNHAVLKKSNYINWDMLETAVDKVTTYHCRIPMFIRTIEQHSTNENMDEIITDEEFEDEFEDEFVEE